MSSEVEHAGPASWAPQAFLRLVGGIQKIIPPFMRHLVPTTFIGYALINGSGFLVDIAFLALFKEVLHWDLKIAVTVGYAIAGLYSLVLNKWLNFQVHGHFLLHGYRYTVGLVAQYVIFVVGLTVVLHDHFGINAEIARFTSACCEGIFLYVVMRIWVFKEALKKKG
ncbi:GtrA family protein [Schaalia sp. 19OD2882]|uniref:GtrA family protein n=1 Tax=Schaalia sp. 19OD2882 TaxID=2794089 RepID=UPI001C1ED882|nr:GtrA family protein [Schaalia sp. 19OD2882]QWW19153.1 GtrA family protein [Schaalia sp. 19OD2882]